MLALIFIVYPPTVFGLETEIKDGRLQTDSRWTFLSGSSQNLSYHGQIQKKIENDKGREELSKTMESRNVSVEPLTFAPLVNPSSGTNLSFPRGERSRD